MSTRGAMPRSLLALALFTSLAVASGCASAPGAPASATPPPAAKAPAPPPAAPRNAATAARNDSLPSPDAERVLATIPEPLSASQQVPPDSSRRRSFVAPEAAYDTLRAEAQDGGATAVPVPAPTPVAAAPVVTFAPPESTARAVPVSPPATSAPAPAAASPAPSPPAPSAPAASGAAPSPAPGPCWRVQVAAPATREEAESRLEAAQSLLVVKMTIVPEKGLFKVRTSDCMTREVADSVKRRALDSGFDGSFLVDTSAPAKPAAKQKSAGGSSR